MDELNTDVGIPILARVEGEGALDLKIRKGKIVKLNLRIYEPPRLFEKFLEKREPNEVIDGVARICGICPVAHQMSAVHAIEKIFEMKPGPWVREMRRLFYCGEWMESHGIHVHILAAPDFLGYDSVMEMVKDHPEIVQRGMRLHALGIELMSLFGRCSVNPMNACVGGFSYAPSVDDVKKVWYKFESALLHAEALVLWAAQLPLPDVEQTFTSVALQHPKEYPMNEGRIVSDQGLNIEVSEFEQYFKEKQMPYSTALHCMLQDEPYLVGPLARMNLNHHLLPDAVRTVLDRININWPSNNMFHSVVARTVEIYYAMVEAIRIMKNYVYPENAYIEMTPAAGVGCSCTEAPRGLLWHRYEFTDEELVKSANIVPPTSQNQAQIEKDLISSLQSYGLDHSDDELRLYSEMVIRNYDPCIYCSTHFLTLKVDRQ